MRPGSRRNGGFQVEQTRRWAEQQGIRRYDGRQAGIARLGRGNRWEGGRSEGDLRAADERIDLARTILRDLGPEAELSPGNWSFVGDLERLAGVPEGSLDAETAYRAAQFMDAGAGGPNLGAREAVQIAVAEQLTRPRENRSGRPRSPSVDARPMQRAFYELGLGRALEAAGDLVPVTSLGGDGVTVDGVLRDPSDPAVQAVRAKVRALGEDEQRLVRATFGHGKKVGTSGRRNALSKETFGEREVGGLVPVLMGQREWQEQWDGPNNPPKRVLEVPRVQQPREQRWVGEERKRLWLTANYGASPMERAKAGQDLKRLEAVKDESAYVLKEDGKARRVRAVDPRGTRQLLIDPSVVLDPMELGLAEDHPLIALAARYSQAEPVRGKLEVGAYEAVGAPNPEGWNTDEFGRAHGFSIPNDPGVPRAATWPTVGQALERMLEEAATPVRTLVMGRRPMEPDWRMVEQYWDAAEVKPMVADLDGQLVIVQERDGRPVPGPAVFAVDSWLPEQGEGDEVFTRRYRVGTNRQWTDKGLEAPRALIQALADYAGMPGDWRLVGDTGLTDPLINAAQNTALRQTLGAEAVTGRGAAVQGQFPDRVERVGYSNRRTVYDNSLFTVLDTIARLGGRPADDARVGPPAIGPVMRGVTGLPVDQAAAMATGAIVDPVYAETWHGVARPLLERVRQVQGARLDAAPGMWRFDDFKTGGIYGGVPVLPPAPAPTMASVMGGYTTNQNAGLPAGLAPRQVVEGLRAPGRLDAGTLDAVQGWLAENVQSPTRTRGTVVGDYSASRPYEPVVDLGAELAANAVSGPGRFGDEVRIAAVPNYAEVVQRAQLAAQGVSLGAASRPTPVPQPTGIGDALRLRTLLRQLAEQGGGASGPSMGELQWQPQARQNAMLGLQGVDPTVGVWGQGLSAASIAPRVDPAMAAPSRPLTQEELVALARLRRM